MSLAFTPAKYATRAASQTSSTVVDLFMLDRISEYLTCGRFWLIKSLVVCLIATLTFSCAPAIWMFPVIELPPAYQLKAENPLADTATLTIPEHEGERSHGAKLSPRLLSSFFLYLSTQLGQHPYLPSSIGGIALLMSGLIVGTKLTGNRSTGLATGLLLAGLYASNACFSMNHGPKPFDGIAIGVVALTAMLLDRPWLFAISAYLACWTDERAIVSLALIGALVTVRARFDTHARQTRYIILAGAIMIYGLTRLLASRLLGWSEASTSMLGDNLSASLSYGQMVAWTCYEGGWIVVGTAALFAFKQGNRRDGVVVIIASLIAMGTCLIVLDLSRAAAFSFPVLFIALAVLNQSAGLARNVTARTTFIAAAVSLLSSNVEIISSIAYSPLPTTPIVLWLRWTT
jgi:hypothetical protein